MKNILLIAVIMVTLSGCAMTETLKDYFVESVLVNDFIKAKDASSQICDQAVYKNLDNFFSPALAQQIINECESKRKSKNGIQTN